MSTRCRIAATEDVSAETTYLFTVEEIESGDEREAILIRHDGEIHGWLNYCQHFTHIKLDKGSGAEMRNGEIICTNHGAYFESDSGFCNFGPCEGAYLPAIEISVDDGTVYLTDEDYEFLRPGAIETDETDLGSKSNYEF